MFKMSDRVSLGQFPWTIGDLRKDIQEQMPQSQEADISLFHLS